MNQVTVNSIFAATFASLFCVSSCSVDRPKTDASGMCPSEAFLTASNRTAGALLQGILVDSFTGQRIDVSKLTGDDGVYVLVGGERIRARSVAPGGDGRMAGEFFICDVPYGSTYQIQALASKYAPFQSTVTVAAQTGTTRTVGTANIRLFPTGVSTKDLVFTVSNAAGVLADATVRLDPVVDAGTNAFSIGNFASFLAPQSVRLVPQVATTGADGKAKFTADTLVLGASYTFLISPKDSLVLKPSAGAAFVMGVGKPTGGTDLYTVATTLAVQ